MNMDAISNIAAVGTPETFATGAAGLERTTQVAGPGQGFGDWVTGQVAQVNTQLLTVEREMQTLAVGGPQSLHQFMIHMEEAKLSFQLMAQVRNRMLEAYQEVMRMQV